MHQRKFASLVAAGAVALTACADDAISPEAEVSAVKLTASEISATQTIQRGSDITLLATSIDEVNEKLAASGSNIALSKAEYVLAANASGSLVDNANHTVYANDRQLRLTSRWVPGDERRAADGDNITYLNWTPWMWPVATGPESEPETDAAVTATFDTWNEVQCSNLELVKRPYTDGPAGAMPSFLLGTGDFFVADIVTIGWVPGILFDIFLGAGASDNVLGVTFTYTFINPDDGTPTDINNDGRDDTALKEVWYNDAFGWTTDAEQAEGAVYDIETVALHENGHALELGHFGKIHATFNNGRGNDRLGTLHVSPRAVMNAAILGTLRSPIATDNASYCSNFAAWPL